MPRKYLVFLTLVTGVLIALGVGIVYKADHAQPKLSVAGKSFTAEIVNSDKTRQQGLSGRESLKADAAMLFVFDQAEERCFWMKDMKFDIDIIWLDASKRIVAIKERAKPSSYPERFCHKNTQYVVEFVAGTARDLGLKTGDQFSW